MATVIKSAAVFVFPGGNRKTAACCCALKRVYVVEPAAPWAPDGKLCYAAFAAWRIACIMARLTID